jgi:hypothetical protein
MVSDQVARAAPCQGRRASLLVESIADQFDPLSTFVMPAKAGIQ